MNAEVRVSHKRMVLSNDAMINHGNNEYRNKTYEDWMDELQYLKSYCHVPWE